MSIRDGNCPINWYSGGGVDCCKPARKPCHIGLGNALESDLYPCRGVLVQKLELLRGATRPTLLLDPPRHCLLPCIVVRVVLLPLDTYSSSSSHANQTLFLMLQVGFSSEEDLSKNKSFAGLSIFSNICLNIVGTMSSVYKSDGLCFFFLINSLIKNI